MFTYIYYRIRYKYILTKYQARLNILINYSPSSIIYLFFLNVLLTTKSRGGYGRHEDETKIK